MLVIIDAMLKAEKNMAQSLHFREVLDDEGYSTGCIQHLSSEEVVAVFHCSILKLVIDEHWLEVLQSKDILFKLVHENGGTLGSKSGPHGCSVCLDKELVVEAGGCLSCSYSANLCKTCQIIGMDTTIT
eukprot:g29911.t1